MKGKQYKHRNGNIYTVLFLTNQNSDPKNKSNYPVQVIYKGQNFKMKSKN